MPLLASRVRNSVSETTTPLRLGVDPRFTDRERQPGLDLLRALAIIVVVIYHSALFGFKLPGRVDRFGWIGVDLFFVLSGYLIGGQLLAPLAPSRPIDLWRFFARRRAADRDRVDSLNTPDLADSVRLDRNHRGCPWNSPHVYAKS